MANTDASTPREVWVHEGGAGRLVADQLAVEEPLEIRVGDEPLAVTMRTPGHDLELAAGFCLTEGVIDDPDDLEAVEHFPRADAGGRVQVRLTDEAMARRASQIEGARRTMYVSSSCGLCGKACIEAIRAKVARPAGAFTVARESLERWPGRLRAAQAGFDRTGGLHAAGLFTPEGGLIVLREDVGRHNAVDKVVGHELLLGRVPLSHAALLVSGRASFEILQKAALAGVALVAAVGAPSSLAVDFAKEMGMTLVGFLRPGRMNVYHDEGRLVQGGSE